MAVKPVTRTVTLPESGHVSLSEVLGMDEDTWAGCIALRAAKLNATDITWRDEHGEDGGYLQAEEAITIDFGEGQGLIRNFTIAGAAGERVYVTVLINRHYFDKSE